MDKHDWPFQAWLWMAVIRFGLTPAEFWAISLTDWLTLLQPQDGGGMRRETFADLMAKHPDKEDENERDG